MGGTGPYDRGFFEARLGGSRSSAEVIVPIVLGLVDCRSVVDVGCGTGEWLAEFRRAGVQDVLGVDGDYVDRRLLKIPGDRFLAADLACPLDLRRRFDLVVSLEVAEHLAAEVAETFVTSLTTLGDVVLFSAAVPHQGGTHHVNERWQGFWASLFEARGFRPIDCVRSSVWDDPRVDWWYAQNTFLYARSERIAADPKLRQAAGAKPCPGLALVHPGCHDALAGRLEHARRLLTDPVYVVTHVSRALWRRRPRRRTRSRES